MKRILELHTDGQKLDESDALNDYCARLLETGRLADSDARKNRVRRALARAEAQPRRFRPAALIAFGALTVSASAAAGFGAYSLLTTDTAPAFTVLGETPTVEKQPATSSVPPQPGPETAALASGQLEIAPQEAPEVDFAPETSARLKGKSSPRADQPALVQEAMQALRAEGDAEKARLLLGRYLRGYPRGALYEEALALSIEANLKHSPAHAGALARRYLAAYPKGRFVAAAEGALGK